MAEEPVKHVYGVYVDGWAVTQFELGQPLADVKTQVEVKFVETRSFDCLPQTKEKNPEGTYK